MRVQQLLKKLEKHHKKKIDLSLDRTFNLLNKLGNPQNKLKNVITVVGTNAKASMCYSLKSILNQAGYKCNLYTSPHLQSLSERFVFNDTEIAEEDLINLLNDIERFLGAENASVFEILTCGFLKYAESFKNNINIIEAGLFHQFDSTNVFKENLFSMIGYIGLDHTQWIQNKTIDGIIHEKTTKLLNSNIFVNKQETTEITNKIKKALDNNLSKKYFFKEDFNISRNENNFIHYQDDLGEILLPEPSILGEHQLGNISTSIAATRKIFQIKDEYIKLGVKNIKLKGRLEELKEGKLKKVIGKNKIFCDGGHNLGASRSLASWIKQQNQEVHVVVGMMKDKAHKEFINHLANFAKSITLIDIPNQEGSISKEEFKKKLGDLGDKILLSNDIKDVLIELSKRKVSSGTLPNKHIYAACTDGSPTDFFTNTEAETFVITDLWMASQVAGSNSSARIYMDGQPLVRISAQQQAISLNSRTGIAVLNGQTLSCDRLSSYGTEVTIIGYYAHTP